MIPHNITKRFLFLNDKHCDNKSNNNINILLALIILHDDIRNITFLQLFNKNLTVMEIK